MYAEKKSFDEYIFSVLCTSVISISIYTNRITIIQPVTGNFQFSTLRSIALS